MLHVKKRKKLDHQLTPHIRIKSKWIKDLHLSWGTLEVLEENIGSKVSYISHSSIFTDTCSRAREIKARINTWDYIKLKSLCMAKENICKMKRKPARWENIFANDTSDNGLISKIYKELMQLHTRKTNIQIKNGQRT